MSDMPEGPLVPLSFVILTGCTTVVLASALAFAFWKSQGNDNVKDEKEEESPQRNEVDREVSTASVLARQHLSKRTYSIVFLAISWWSLDCLLWLPNWDGRVLCSTD
jgi:hypothetical protein